LRDAGQSSFGRNCGHIQPQPKNCQAPSVCTPAS
jgi:hypothetical protein